MLIPQVQFVNGQVLFRSGFGQPTPQVAMSPKCCCGSTITRPGYVIFARDCCTGEQLPILLDLTRPPAWVFAHVFHDGINTCFEFNLGDVGTAILATDPAAVGVDFFAGSYTRHGGCNECRCAHTLPKCCYGYHLYPSGGPGGLRTGFSYYEIAGITVDPSIFVCKFIGTSATTGLPIYQQVQPFIVPSGTFTEKTEGGDVSTTTWQPFDSCPDNLKPEFLVIVRYYDDSSCHTPSAYFSGSQTTYMQVTPNNISALAIGDPLLGSNLFSNGSLTLGPDGCNDRVLSNANVAGVNAGYGGTITIKNCCPTEDGGV